MKYAALFYLHVLGGQAKQRISGLGLKVPDDNSDYCPEHMKKNYEERPWIGYIWTRVPGRCPPDSTRDGGPTSAISDTTCRGSNGALISPRNNMDEQQSGRFLTLKFHSWFMIWW